MRKSLSPLEKEWNKVEKQEQTYMQKRMEKKDSRLNQLLEKKVPQSLQSKLDIAFSKAFYLIFEKGTGIIEKTYSREELEKTYQINEYTEQVRKNRKSLKTFSQKAASAGNVNLLLSGVSGIGLGVLGIGIPDIVLFTGLMLKSVYEIALNYGFDYEDKREQLLILKMMAASLLSGEEWQEANAEVNAILNIPDGYVDEEELREQLERTASVFAMDMLILKFIQGLPVVGIFGGVANPIYYKRVLNYVQLKYRKRYLLKQMK